MTMLTDRDEDKDRNPQRCASPQLERDVLWSFPLGSLARLCLSRASFPVTCGCDQSLKSLFSGRPSWRQASRNLTDSGFWYRTSSTAYRPSVPCHSDASPRRFD
jgi:hypothetical protein